MERIVVLAGSLREANAYCRDKGIRALFASTSTQVQKATKIIELPGFAQRRDRFTLASSRDSRLKYGKGVEFIDEADWVAPKKVLDEADQITEPIQGLVLPLGVPDYGDLTDEANLNALKMALNRVGFTLKKLPPKKTQAEAPVVDAPVEF